MIRCLLLTQFWFFLYRFVDFFEPLKSFVVFLRLGAEYEEQLKALEKNFVVVCVLFQKYEKIFCELVKCANDRHTPNADVNRIFSFGWNLFLVAKGINNNLLYSLAGVFFRLFFLKNEP